MDQSEICASYTRIIFGLAVTTFFGMFLPLPSHNNQPKLWNILSIGRLENDKYAREGKIKIDKPNQYRLLVYRGTGEETRSEQTAAGGEEVGRSRAGTCGR